MSEQLNQGDAPSEGPPEPIDANAGATLFGLLANGANMGLRDAQRAVGAVRALVREEIAARERERGDETIKQPFNIGAGTKICDKCHRVPRECSCQKEPEPRDDAEALEAAYIAYRDEPPAYEREWRPIEGHKAAIDSACRAYADKLREGDKAKIAELKGWKESALAVEKEWDDQAVGKEIGLRLGRSIRPAILPELVKRREKIVELEADKARLEGELRDNLIILRGADKKIAHLEARPGPAPSVREAATAAQERLSREIILHGGLKDSWPNYSEEITGIIADAFASFGPRLDKAEIDKRIESTVFAHYGIKEWRYARHSAYQLREDLRVRFSDLAPPAQPPPGAGLTEEDEKLIDFCRSLEDLGRTTTASNVDAKRLVGVIDRLRARANVAPIPERATEEMARAAFDDFWEGQPGKPPWNAQDRNRWLCHVNAALNAARKEARDVKETE